MNLYEENTIQYEEVTEEKKEKKENILFGIIGALLGSLIGMLLWILVYNLGYIAAFVGIIMIVCSIKGYEIFSGTLSKKGIIIILIINIFMVYASMHISLGLEIYNIFKDEYYITIFDAIKFVPDFILEPGEVQSAFFKDLLLGYLFTGIGIFSTIKKALSENN